MQWTPEQIRHHRRLRGWSQDDAARELGVSRRSISAWESETDDTLPQGRHIESLNRVFGTELTLAVATDLQLMAELTRRLTPGATGDAKRWAADLKLIAELTRRLAIRAEQEGADVDPGLPDRDLVWPRQDDSRGHRNNQSSNGA